MSEEVKTASESLNIVQEPILDKKKERRFFSGIGLNYFIFTMVVIVFQMIASILMHRFASWDFINTFGIIISVGVIYVIGYPVLIWLSKRKEPITLEKHSLGIGKFLIVLLMCYGVMILGNIIGLCVTNVIGAIRGTQVQNSVMNVMSSNTIWVNIVIVGICAPIFEEIMFRKLLIDRVARYGEGIAVLLSGLMFGLFHGNFSQFFYAFFLGMIFAYVYVKTGKLKYTIILHILINMGTTLILPILQSIDMGIIAKAEEYLANPGDPSQFLTAVGSSILPFLILLAYELLIYGMGIAGLILLIVNRKKFICNKGEVVIPKGKRFSIVWCNTGMILYTAVWIVMFAVSVLG